MYCRCKKIFISGCPRSGTTWVYSFFRHHPEAVTADDSVTESHIYSIALRALGSLKMSEDEAWSYILAEYDDLQKNIGKKTFLNERGNYVGPYGGLALYITRDKLCEHIRILKNRKKVSRLQKGRLLAEAILNDVFRASRNSKKRILAEKSPENIFYAQDILRGTDESKIIEVVRDGRDVCISLGERSKAEGWCPESREEQIDFWLNYVKQGLKLRSRNRFVGRILRVRYEDLHDDPEQEIKKIFKFAAIDSSSAIIRRIVKLADIKRLSTTDGHYRAGRVGDWKKYFVAEDIALFKQHADACLRALGYGWD